jgi:hypothetical protein
MQHGASPVRAPGAHESKANCNSVSNALDHKYKIVKKASQERASDLCGTRCTVQIITYLRYRNRAAADLCTDPLGTLTQSSQRTTYGVECPSVHQSLYEYAAEWLGPTQPLRDCILNGLTLYAICGAAYNDGI